MGDPDYLSAICHRLKYMNVINVRYKREKKIAPTGTWFDLGTLMLDFIGLARHHPQFGRVSSNEQKTRMFL